MPPQNWKFAIAKEKTLPALQKTFVILSTNWGLALKNGGDFGRNFSGLRFPANKAQKLSEPFAMGPVRFS